DAADRVAELVGDQGRQRAREGHRHWRALRGAGRGDDVCRGQGEVGQAEVGRPAGILRGGGGREGPGGRVRGGRSGRGRAWGGAREGVGRPLGSVKPVAEFVPLPPNLPPAPLAGAVKITGIPPGAGPPSEFLTWTLSGWPKAAPTVVVWKEPLTTVIVPTNVL